jgi:EAL and modified HD-GYP domain-containing signal transduction protein
MTDTPSQEHADHPLRVRDFYLGRQPVLDRNQALFGYELLFRSTPLGQANIGQGAAPASTPGLNATAAVIAHAAQLGLARAIGDAHCFLNVDADVLASDIYAFLPRERTVLELAASVAPSDAVLARMAELASHGFQFALDGIGSAGAGADAGGDAGGDDPARLQKLLPLARFIKLDLRKLDLRKLDLRNTAQPALGGLVARLHGMHKIVVADKVETRDEYQACLELGADYFQGYYFARPSVLGGRKLSPSQLAVLELMKLVTSDVDNADIERAVKRDVTVAMNLLRLVNTPAVGVRQRIDSVSQALLVLGRRQLQRWLQIMLFAEPGTRGHNQSPLLMLATTRGRLMELLAQRLRPGQRYLSEIAFTVGIMSLMDVLFGIPMTDIVEQIPVSDEITSALLRRTGFFGELLKLAECIEQPDSQDEGVLPSLRGLAISGDDMVELEMEAFQWSDSVVRYAI